MNSKAKDCVFACSLVLLGAYVVWESRNMVLLASKPPFNIKDFSISPGMLPMMLGALLIFFSLILLILSLRGGGNPFRSVVGHFREASLRFNEALENRNILRAVACVEVMAIYTFALLGMLPFWAGAFLYLVTIMILLRSARIWTIVFTSGAVIAVVVLLFEGVFKTSLP